jgi:hypothetical protein
MTVASVIFTEFMTLDATWSVMVQTTRCGHVAWQPASHPTPKRCAKVRAISRRERS